MYASRLIWHLEPDKWVDPWGIATQVQRIAETKRIFETDETYYHDNGYEIQRLAVWVDTKGGRFVKPHPIDFGGSSNWLCLSPGVGQTVRVWWSDYLSGRILDEKGDPLRTERGQAVVR